MLRLSHTQKSLWTQPSICSTTEAPYCLRYAASSQPARVARVCSEVYLCSSTRGTKHGITIQTARTQSHIDVCIFFYSIFCLRQFCSEHWANRCRTTSSSRVLMWVSSHKCLAISRRRLGPPCVPAVTFVFRQYGRTCEGHSDCCLDSYRCGRCCSLKKNKKQDAAF